MLDPQNQGHPRKRQAFDPQEFELACGDSAEHKKQAFPQNHVFKFKPG